MAFGFGFNKTKVLSSAEKYVQQGKLPNAIAEYQKILKNDPKDLTVMNTVGDLYARLGQSEEACTCFKNVGDAYAQQGFTVKAIAMYKKLTKIKSSLEGTLKLAELYTQQGLFNDARQQYLQVAEEFLRTGDLEQAVRIFQKTLEMDPENVAMKVRLAEVYVRLGKKSDAWQIFSAAAEQLRSRGQLAPAEDILQRMLKLDPKNSQALLMRGRNCLEAGDSAAAIHHLEKIPDIDSQPESLKLFFQARLAAEQLSEAGVLATKLLNLHGDLSGIKTFVDALMKGGLYEDALKMMNQYADPLMAADQAKFLQDLHGVIGHVRHDPNALQGLLALFEKAGDTSHVGEVTELLAHASVQTGDLESARDLYQRLSTIEPANALHTQNLQQVAERMGEPVNSGPISAEEAGVIIEELDASAPNVEQSYSEEIGAAVRAALTDAELFVSYNMAAKALEPLAAVLPQAPEDLRLNQKLAALYIRAGKLAEAAGCCRVLEKAYTSVDEQEHASRYGNLAARLEERCAVDAGEPVVTEAAAEAEPAVPWPSAPPAEVGTYFAPPVTGEAAVAMDSSEESSASEVDLSAEWEESLSVEEPAPTPAAAATSAAPVATEPPPADAGPSNDELIAEAVDEVRFYLQHSMRLQALASMAKLESLTQDESLIAALRSEYEGAFAPTPVSERQPAAPSAPEPAVLEGAEPPASEFEVQKPEVGQAAAQAQADMGGGLEELAEEPQPEPVKAVAPAAPQENTLGEFVADLEDALGEDFLSAEPAKPAAPAASAPAPSRVSVPAAPARPAAQVPVPPVAAAAAASASPSASTFSHQQHADMASLLAPGIAGSASGSDLSQMFDELKGELEEDTVSTAADADPETHYNLGVAFREMGLLDEAIGELQKVCQIVDRGQSFPQIMQAYTWLAQCFLDKGVPEAAIRWYQQALKVPTIDQETQTALHYELASAYESAQKRSEALSHFLQVYGTNIDYRDVAERIKALKS